MDVRLNGKYGQGLRYQALPDALPVRPDFVFIAMKGDDCPND
jgi:hypothetical protein